MADARIDFLRRTDRRSSAPRRDAQPQPVASGVLTPRETEVQEPISEFRVCRHRGVAALRGWSEVSNQIPSPDQHYRPDERMGPPNPGREVDTDDGRSYS